jgi:hypothetical protein
LKPNSESAEEETTAERITPELNVEAQWPDTRLLRFDGRLSGGELYANAGIKRKRPGPAVKSSLPHWSAPEDVFRASEFSQTLQRLKSRLYRQALVNYASHRFGITA